MLRWAIGLAVLAILLSLLGFSGAAGVSSNFAWLFLVGAVVLIVLGLIFGRSSGIPPTY